jgi:hypothetical protein
MRDPVARATYPSLDLAMKLNPDFITLRAAFSPEAHAQIGRLVPGSLDYLLSSCSERELRKPIAIGGAGYPSKQASASFDCKPSISLLVSVLLDASSQRHRTCLSCDTCTSVGQNPKSLKRTNRGASSLDAGVTELEEMTRGEATQAYPEAILRNLQNA